jgi:hypothetical protein
MTFSREVMQKKITPKPYIQYHTFNRSKMADVLTSEEDGKLAPINVGS